MLSLGTMKDVADRMRTGLTVCLHGGGAHK